MNKLKWKRIGDILILDSKFDYESYDDLENLSRKHNVKTIMKIDHIQGTKREPVYTVLYGDETVMDMFAGIGYFSIPIGVHSNAKHVYSIEINPNSYFYLKENIKLNKLTNVTPILGDCMEQAPKYNADRIVMGYVKTTHHYLKVAIDSLNEGGILHYHETVPEKLMKTRPIERVISQAGSRDVELLKLNKIKKYAPGVEHVVLDVRIT